MLRQFFSKNMHLMYINPIRNIISKRWWLLLYWNRTTLSGVKRMNRLKPTPTLQKHGKKA
jgi:hypothetical protein